MVLNVNVILNDLNDDKRQRAELNRDQAISKATSVFNESLFELLVEYRLNQSDCEQVRDVEAFNLSGNGREEIIVISAIWNGSDDVKGLIQVFDYDYYNDSSALLDSLVLSNSSNDVALFEVDLFDIDEDGTTEIVITGGINSQGWAFLKVYNFTAGQLNFEWDEWWFSTYSGSLTLSANDVLFADFDNDTVTEVCTVTTISVTYQNHNNTVRFWNVSGNDLVLENQFDFQTSYIELDWRNDDNLWAADVDADNYTEILIFGAHNSGGAGDSANLYALNYTGSALNEEAQIVWSYSGFGPGEQGLEIGDFDDDGELEILAKFQWRPTADPICHAHYNMINYSGNQFNEEFGATYWTPGSTHQRPGHWFAKNFDADSELEFISTDYYENNTAFLRIWDYIGGILINSEIERIATDCTYQPPYLCFLNNNSHFAIFYSKQDASGYQLYFSIHGMYPPVLEPIYPNPDYDGYNIALQWANTSEATNYTVYRSNSPITVLNGSQTIVGTTTANSIQDGYLPNGTYYYAVQANYLNRKSGPSNCENVTVSIIPNRRDCIKIAGDDQFTAANGVSNPAAAGNETDPFLISNWAVITGPLDAACIEIQNTRAHFVISDCTLSNAPIGIKLDNVTNGAITNNKVNMTSTGIYLETSDNNSLTDNTINGGSNGIYLDGSSNYNTLTNNTANGNTYGFTLAAAGYNTLSHNTAIGNTEGFRISGNNNTLTDNTAMSNSFIGIDIWGNGHNLTHNTVTQNGIGIFMGGWYHVVTNNTVTSNVGFGMHLTSSSFCIINDNNISDNGDAGIYMYGFCRNNTMTSNIMNFNGAQGIYLEADILPMLYNKFIHNTIMSNSWYGVQIEGADDSEFHLNIIIDNHDGTLANQIWDSGSRTIWRWTIYELDIDSDGDFLTNHQEWTFWTNPYSADTDNDTLSDPFEIFYGIDPLDVDTDGDGLDDGDEFIHSTSAKNPDSDADGLSDGDEVHVHFTSPISQDTDGDGLTDPDELGNNTDPTLADTDRDFLDDAAEQALGTDPNVSDTDGDGVLDGIEVGMGTDPLNPNSFPGDSLNFLMILSIIFGVITVGLALGLTFFLRKSRSMKTEIDSIKEQIKAMKKSEKSNVSKEQAPSAPEKPPKES